MLHHKYTIERVSDKFDPERCQATIKSQGQCFLRSTPNSKYCPCHGGDLDEQRIVKQNIYKLHHARFQQRVDELTNAEGIKGLRDEIAIVRFLVQTILESCTDSNTLSQHSTILSRLIAQVESLAITCAKVELSLDSIMDQTDAFNLAHEMLIKISTVTQVPDEMYEDIKDLLKRLHLDRSGSIATNYQLKQWKEEIATFLTTDRIISLRGEIGVMRLLIEEKLNSIKCKYDLMLAAGPILESIKTIERLVASCHRLEVSMGLLLDEDQAKAFGQELITIIGNYIKDSVMLGKIC